MSRSDGATRSKADEITSDPMAVARWVLVVEDDAGVRTLLDRVLSVAGYRVQTARTAQDAAAFMLYDLPHVPDIAIIDIVLPGMNGIAFADDLRSRYPTVRTVFVTGWLDNPQQREAAERRGVLLMKPFEIDALLAVLQRDRGDITATVGSRRDARTAP